MFSLIVSSIESSEMILTYNMDFKMSRHSKAKRDAKKKKRLKLRNNNQKLEPKKTDSQGPVLTQMENPFDHLTDEQRKEVIDQISKKSIDSLPKTIDALFEILKQYSPTVLISILASNSLIQGIGDEGVVSLESKTSIEQYHVELLQAFILKLPTEELGKKMPPPAITKEVMDKLVEISGHSTMSRFSSKLVDESEENKAISLIQEHLRSHTQAVRNWGYNSQIKNISTELYSKFDVFLTINYGFSASDIIQLFSLLITMSEDKLTVRLDMLKDLYRTKQTQDLLDKYCQYLGFSLEDKKFIESQLNIEKLKVKELFMKLLEHSDTLLISLFIIDIKKISNALSFEEKKSKAILEHFSFAFGDLEDKETSHIFLDNPVWTKPVILDKGNFYCVLPQLFFSFILDSMDELVEPLAKVKFHELKAEYLEDKIEQIVKTRFPSSLTIAGAKWELDGKIFETDLITFIDSHAIIFEAKSHKVTKPALRGAPRRIKRHLKDIFIEPSIQSHRFEQRLRFLIDNPDVEDPLRKELPVDLTNIKKILRVSVSFDDFATLQTNIHLFEKTGWLPDDFQSCPSMNLADFQTLFDFLEHPVQIIHYLERRREIEKKYKIIGDELDFMGMYITTLLDFGIFSGYAESDGNIINIVGMSKSLDNYYQSKDAGINIPKPQPKISSWFKQIFEQLEKRSTPGWSQIGSILNRFPFEEQMKLERNIIDLTRIVNRTWEKEGHKNLIIFCPHEASEFALVVVLYKNSNAEMRNTFINEASYDALQPKHVSQCLIIAKNIDIEDDAPYHLIGLRQEKSDSARN